MFFKNCAQVGFLFPNVAVLFKRHRGFFQRLQWRLTLCYMLVAVVAAPFLIIPLALADPGPQQDLVNVMASRVAPRVAAYLEQMPLSEKALATWANAFVHRTSDQETVFAETILGETSGPIQLVVVDQHERVVLSASSGRTFPLPTLLSNLQARQVIRAALTEQGGKRLLADRVSSFPDGRTGVAVSLLAADGRLLGALFTVVDVQTAKRELIVSALNSLLLNALPLILLAGGVGAFAGMLASRPLIRRIHRLVQAAHAWSRGEFQRLVHDPSQDELGGLARDLNRMVEQVRSLLSVQQRLAIIEERHRVARDLHDSVKQHLFATTLLIGAARAQVFQNAGNAQTYLTEAEELTTQARKELTGIIEQLRPATLAQKGLAAVLQEYITLWSRRTGITAQMQISYALPAPPEIEETLLRVMQEALANVARHSEASQVQVQLVREYAWLHLTIRDNGKGFEVTHPTSNGLGIVHMRERVEAHCGTLSLSSAAIGTSIELSVPLAPTVLLDQ